MSRQMSKRTLFMTIIIILIIIGYFVFFPPSETESTELDFSNQTISVTGAADAVFSLPMEDVASCTLRDDWEIGELVSGGETARTIYGIRRNAEVGEYRLFASPELTKWVVLVSKSGDTYVINRESNDTTKELHAALHRYFTELGLQVAGAPGS